jgi:hypothetical protein
MVHCLSRTVLSLAQTPATQGAKHYVQVLKIHLAYSDVSRGGRRCLAIVLGVLLLMQMSGCGRKTPLKPRRAALPCHRATVCIVKAC